MKRPHLTSPRRLAAALLASTFAALAMAGLSASATGAASRASDYWLVFGSNRDGETRAYSVRPDGSRLTMLLPTELGFVTPIAVSRNGRTIAYQLSGSDESPPEEIAVSRADGSGFRSLVKSTEGVLSPDGSRLAFTVLHKSSSRLFVIGTNGRGRRRLTSTGDVYYPDWSPDGKALVYHVEGHGRPALVIQPLRGKRRVLVRGSELETPRWSPDGKWIAYGGAKGLDLIRPSGAGLHLVARGSIFTFAWSPDGKKLAFWDGAKAFVVGRDGRARRRLRLPRVDGVDSISWSPDSRLLAFAAAGTSRWTKADIWIIGADGKGLRLVADEGLNTPVGWSRLAPALPPAPPLLPSEWALGPTSVATRRPISDLSADGGRVAFVVGWTGADCEHVAVWTPATQALNRFQKPSNACDGSREGSIDGVELAGTRAAWAAYSDCGNYCEVALETATLEQPSPVAVGDDSAEEGEAVDFHLHGDGDLLVFDQGDKLVRIGVGTEKCWNGLCTTLRAGAHAAPVDSVSAGLIAVREGDGVAVLDSKGSLVDVVPFGQNEVKQARLDSGRLVVASAGVLQVYDASTGAALQQRPLPAGYSLADVDGGIAVLRHADSIMLLRLDDGRSLTVAPGLGPVLAELEPPGLYYSYVTPDGGGRMVFVPRAQLLQQLG